MTEIDEYTYYILQGEVEEVNPSTHPVRCVTDVSHDKDGLVGQLYPCN